jgi:hypothetical protein
MGRIKLDTTGASVPAEPAAADWEEPLPLGGTSRVPPWPAGCLPPWLDGWVFAVSEATQTPPDLAGVLALAVTGAGLAKKFRVKVRDGWTEPTNLWGVVALPSGDRKSAVFAEAVAPVLAVEKKLLAEKEQAIAEKASEHRTLVNRRKHLEKKAAEAASHADREKYKREAKDAAVELARHQVPEPPRLVIDDCTPEKLPGLLAAQGGRILQAAAEGTPFELVKGRYSDSPNFDVYLKTHAGDDVRVDRVSRGRDFVVSPR